MVCPLAVRVQVVNCRYVGRGVIAFKETGQALSVCCGCKDHKYSVYQMEGLLPVSASNLAGAFDYVPKILDR